MLISPNTVLSESQAFGDFDKATIQRLLYNIQADFAKYLGIKEVFKSKTVCISYGEMNPAIYDMGVTHHVCLHVHGNDFNRWVYQFAHEYCHHLINGPMRGGISGLLWFEETLCDVSSIYHLERLFLHCGEWGICTTAPILPFLQANKGEAPEDCKEYIRSNLALLCGKEYQRPIYARISAAMLPFFQANPYLWRSLLHVGNSRGWKSLPELFDHLQATADDTYSYSLGKLRDLLA